MQFQARIYLIQFATEIHICKSRWIIIHDSKITSKYDLVNIVIKWKLELWIKNYKAY